MRSKLVLVAFLVILLTIASGTQLVFAQGVDFVQVTTANTPWDAVPSANGKIIYFTSIGSDGVPGIFSVPDGSPEITTIASGRPFVMPFGIAISTDGTTLYVTDPWQVGTAGNAVFAASISSGSVEVIAGTQGTTPQGIEVVSRDGADQIYFTGTNPENNQPAVYLIAGSAVTIVAQGAPLAAPSGVTAAKDGGVYVLDRLASGHGLGSVLRIRNNTVETIAANIRTGAQLAGLTLLTDESALLVSSLDAAAGTAQVLVINVATLEISIVNNVINANTAAGGLHRAHNVDIFAWVDNGGGGCSPCGRLYCVKAHG